MKEFFDNLSQSERRTLAIAGVVLVILLFYALVWQPANKKVASLKSTLQSQRELAVWMQSAAEQANALRASQRSTPGAARGNRSLLALVDQTARQRKLGPALKRVEPRGQDEVRVRLENASFDDTVSWLVSLQQQFGINVDTVSIDRQDSPGRVDANVSLKEGAA